jgi:putative tricarboxylic transport membrane protein
MAGMYHSVNECKVELGVFRMSNADRISGIFWLVFSGLVSIESYSLGLGSLRQPGPGFLFFWTAIAMMILSIMVFIGAWAGKKVAEPPIPIFGKGNAVKIILVLLALFLYAFFMETLGFIPVTLLLFIFLLGVIEKKKWGFAIFVSVLVTGVSYWIFELWLKSQLPKGLLGF